jgi:hypothetical protein
MTVGQTLASDQDCDAGNDLRRNGASASSGDFL